MYISEKIMKILDKFIIVAQDILNKNYYNSQPEYFLFLKVFERFSVNIESVNILLADLENNISREVPIKLILRANLLDFILINYLGNLISKIKCKGDEFEIEYLKELDKILCEQAKYDFGNLKLLKNDNIITDQEYKDKIDEILKVFHIYISGEINYDNPIKNLKYKEFTPVKFKFRESCKNELTKKFANIYPLYQKFSKYEHVGLLTQHYQSEDHQKIIDDIIFAIKFCVKGSLFCCHMINCDDAEIEMIKQIEEELK